MKILAALLLGSIATVAGAQMGPGPRHPPAPPSPEALATIPNLSAAQQTDLRRILIETRDAHEAAASRSRSEHEALAKKDRAEHERIEEQGAERLRKLLGDDGFKQFAEWQMAHRPPGRRHDAGPGAGPGPGGPRLGPGRPAADRTAMAADDADDDDAP
jgi:hypothetical protein